jgi:hypothetical protein
METR